MVFRKLITPIEKAELLKTDYMNIRWDIYPDDAIKCSLINVNNIINELDYLKNIKDCNQYIYSSLEFYQQVKIELEKRLSNYQIN